MGLYERLGGAPAVEHLIDELSRRLREDSRLGPVFAGLDHKLLDKHRTAYLAVIVDGPEEYEGRSMRQAHQALGLSDADMEAFLAILRGVLDDAHIEAQNAAGVVRAIERLRPAIIAATWPHPASPVDGGRDHSR